MRKSKKRLNINRRNFLTGSVTLAGVAAATSVLPLSIAKANHEDSDPKGLPDFIKWKMTNDWKLLNKWPQGVGTIDNHLAYWPPQLNCKALPLDFVKYLEIVVVAV